MINKLLLKKLSHGITFKTKFMADNLTRFACTSSIKTQNCDLLNPRRLPLYLYISNALKSKVFPSSLASGLKENFDIYNSKLVQLQNSDDYKNISDVDIINNELESIESKMLNLLLSQVETSIEAILDPNIIYLEVTCNKGSNEANAFKDIILEMYFQFANYFNWNLSLISHSISNTKIKISGNKVYDFLRFETGIHKLVLNSNSRGCFKSLLQNVSGKNYALINVIVRPHFHDRFLPVLEPKDLEIQTIDNCVYVKHLPSMYECSSSGHKNIIRDKTEALFKLKQWLKSEEYFKTMNVLPTSSNKKYLPPSNGKVSEIVRVSFGGNVVDERLKHQVFVKDHSCFLIAKDLKALLDELSTSLRKSFLEDSIHTFFESEKILGELVLDLSLLNTMKLNKNSNNSDMRELNEIKKNLLKTEHLLEETCRRLKEKSAANEILEEKLKQKEALIFKYFREAKDELYLVKHHNEHEKNQLYSLITHKENAISRLIDTKYVDRLSLSESQFHLKHELQKALETVEQNKRELVNKNMLIKDLSLKVGNTVKKDKEIEDLKNDLNLLRNDMDRTSLLNHLHKTELQLKTSLSVEKTLRTKNVSFEEKIRNIQKSLDMKTEDLNNHKAIEISVHEKDSIIKQMKYLLKENAKEKMELENKYLKLDVDVKKVAKELEASQQREKTAAQALAMEKDEKKELLKRIYELTTKTQNLEKERNDYKDTVDQLIAFQQRKLS